MKYLHNLIILISIITFSLEQKPKGIRIFNVNYNKNSFYEHTVFKNEEFGFQFTRGRGTNCHWEHLEDDELKESNSIQFLYKCIYDYISEENQRQEELAKNYSNSNGISFHYTPILGGSEYYYEVFKALNEKNQPQILKFKYSCGYNIITEVNIKIWICDEIYKEQCIDNDKMKCIYDTENKKCTSNILCDKIEDISKQACEKGITSTPSLTKCTFEKTGNEEKCIIKNLCTNSFSEEECNSAVALNPITSHCAYDELEQVCTEEKKFCYEIDKDATKEICKNAEAFDINKECVLNNEENSCIEINALIDDKGIYLMKMHYLFLILYLMLFI